MYETGFVEKRKLYLKGNVCLARISLEDLVHPDYVNRGVRVKKYFNGGFDEPGIGGWDTAILNPPASYPHVCFNNFLNRYVMVAQEFTTEEQLLKWYVSAIEGKLEEALLQWNYMGILEQSKPRAFYPRLVNEEGTDSREIGKDAWLFYCTSVPGFLGQINPRMFRRKVTFEL